MEFIKDFEYEMRMLRPLRLSLHHTPAWFAWFSELTGIGVRFSVRLNHQIGRFATNGRDGCGLRSFAGLGRKCKLAVCQSRQLSGLPTTLGQDSCIFRVHADPKLTSIFLCPHRILNAIR